ncbi:hypothetical protein BN1708_018837, partial [Verticillium longisporum]
GCCKHCLARELPQVSHRHY